MSSKLLIRLAISGTTLLAPALLAAPAAAAGAVQSAGTLSAPAVQALLERSGVPVDGRAVAGTSLKAAEPALEQLDRAWPLPPEYRMLHDQVPPKSDALVRALGLPDGPHRTTDLTGRTPSAAELIDALK